MLGWIDILPVGLLILVFWNANVIKPFSKVDTDGYLSIDTTKCYRGLFAIVIIFHHLAQRTETGILFPFFSRVGFLAVAVFFFLSGYGLQKSYLIKGEGYKRTFIQRRIPKILVPYILATFIYWLAYYLTGTTYSFKDVIIGLVNGYPVVRYSWYIISILCFYLFYWILMKLCKKNRLAMIILGCVYYAIYSALCIKLDISAYWFNASHLLIIGMIWATYEKTINQLVKRTYPYALVLVWVFFIVLFSIDSKMVLSAKHSFLVSTFLTIIESLLFTIGVLLLSMKIRIGNSFLRVLGDMSLQIYLFHGLFILFIKEIINVQNELLWCVLVIAFTLILARFVHFLMTRLLGGKSQKIFHS